MSVLAPAWAVGAQALDGQGDHHIPDGIHFRVVTDPLLGLPLRPLAIYRWNLGSSGKTAGTRTDVTWVDSFGTVLTAPFDVTPDNPVTGYLPSGISSRCVWVRVDGEPASPFTVRPSVSTDGGVASGGGLRTDATIDRSTLADSLRERLSTPSHGTLDVHSETLGLRDVRRDLLELAARIPNLSALFQGKLRVDAWKSTEYGLQIIGARDTQPYDIGASEINGVVVTGRGTVRGITWIDWMRMNPDQMRPWRLIGLPVEHADRYQGLPNALQKSQQRVLHSAPKRFGMHDEPTAASPATAPAAGAADEASRLTALRPQVDGLLTELLQHGPVHQAYQTITEAQPAIDLPPDTTVSEVAYSPLNSVLLGAADPTIGRYLGFLDRDEAPAAQKHDVVCYLIRGFWSVDLVSMLSVESLAANLTKIPGLVSANGGIVTASSPPEDSSLEFSIPRSEGLDVDGDGKVEIGDNSEDTPLYVYDWWVPAITTYGAPLLPPWVPKVDEQLSPTNPSSPDGQGHWNTDFDPPEARRHVELPVSELVPGASLAFARNESGAITGLNRRFDVAGSSVPDRAFGMLPTLPNTATTPSEGTVKDREAPADALEYRVAQQDWFGRWSKWGQEDVPKKVRPGPPAPVINAEYTLAAVPDPMHSNPLWGTLTVRCRLPPVSALAPGGFLLKTLRISGTVDGVAIAPPLDLPVPAAWAGNASGIFTTLTTTVAGGPTIIPRGGSIEAVLQGTLIDTDNQHSAASQDAEVTCVDPRPPDPVVIDPTLTYTARPDATGRARVTLEWQVPANARRFRVYFCDETRLVDRLERMSNGHDPVEAPDTTYTPSPAEQAGASALLLARTAAGTDQAVQAQSFTDPGRPALLLRPWFQQLTGEPVEASPGATSMSFQHELSGSLRTLAFYRVVSVSETNVESDFAISPVVPFAVPNLGGPAAPMLEVIKVADDDPSPLAAGSVRLKVRLSRGSQPPDRLRLRRSSVQSGDHRRMAIASEQVINVSAPTPANSGDPQPAWEFTVDDDGAYQHDPSATLRPFTRYSWRAEVQAPSLPGSALPGEWSRPSPAVSTMLLPEAPLAPVEVTVVAAGLTVTLSWTHPGPIEGGAMGPYRFDVYRKRPGRTNREERIGSVSADAPKDISGNHFLEDVWAVAPELGTTYRVVVLDPAGRLSPPSNPLTLS